MRADIIIRNCMILTMSEQGVVKRGLIALKNGKIIYVGKEIEAPVFEAEKIISGGGKIVMPGLINCHTHVAMTLFRSMAEDRRLDEWLREIIWPLEAKLKPQDVYHGALLGCIEMIRSGTTCFSDMYFHEDMVAKAVAETGLRCILSPGILDAGQETLGKMLLKKAISIVENYHGAANGRILTMLGPHAVYSCSRRLLRKVAEKSSELNVGIHMHLAESLSESVNVKEKYGKSEVEVLDELRLLGPRFLAAHCIHLSDTDIALMTEHDVKVAYNPVSNMKLATGIPRIKDLIDAGLTVGLGTDGPASNNSLDMFETMKFAALLQKVKYGDPRVLSAKRVVEMATIDGARALGLDNLIGSLEVGKKADIIVIDADKPHLTPIYDPYATIVYSARGSDVSTVIVDGKIVMENGEIKTVDENKIMEKAEEASRDLLNRSSLRGKLLTLFLRREM